MDPQILLIVLLVAAIANLVVGILVLARDPARREAELLRTLREELRHGREEDAAAARALRDELRQGSEAAAAALGQRIADANSQNLAALETLRVSLATGVKALQEGNERKLEEMRVTVDEKLHGTLEKRLGESFQLVSNQLEAVQRGLGEMQSLATGVGDLKKVLTNVKLRGTWGEVQLRAILEQILTPDQYL